MLNHRISNELNQYTAIDSFTPQYDADGNQTLIKTSTGVWSVTYNAENRPVRWESGDTVVTMDFDRMGRRTFYKEEVNGVVTKHHRFVYDNYLCVQKVDALNNNSQINLFVWDPTEPVATRPLFTQRGTGYKFFYTCDGNKNVSELVHFETRNGIAAHYDYAPFGAVIRAISASAVADNTFITDNPFRFSSEYHDDTLGLVYYNYRHYNTTDGRWCGRDIKGEEVTKNLFNAMMNRPLNVVDLRGNDIYLMTGNDSDNPLNNMLHQAVCVDVWGKDCKQIGILCFSFGQVGWRWNSGSYKWLGYENSWTLIGFFMYGEVYKHSVVETATIVALKKTTKQEDCQFAKEMEEKCGQTDIHSVFRHNCRNFSQRAFENAPGKEEDISK